MRAVHSGNPFMQRSNFRRMSRYTRIAMIFAFLMAVGAGPAAGQSREPDALQDEKTEEPEANPARPTVSNPATLAPVGYLQFETGTLGATDSPEFSTRYEFNEVIKLAVSRRIEFIESSEPALHYTLDRISANGTAEVFLGAQVVLMPGEGATPTLS